MACSRWPFPSYPSFRTSCVIKAIAQSLGPMIRSSSYDRACLPSWAKRPFFRLSRAHASLRFSEPCPFCPHTPACWAVTRADSPFCRKSAVTLVRDIMNPAWLLSSASSSVMLSLKPPLRTSPCPSSCTPSSSRLSSSSCPREGSAASKRHTAVRKMV